MKNGTEKVFDKYSKKWSFVPLCFGSKSKIIREPITCNQEPSINSIWVAESHSDPRGKFDKCKDCVQTGWVNWSWSPQEETRFAEIDQKQKRAQVPSCPHLSRTS